MLFTDEQVGKYVRLLCCQHQHGHLTEKDMLSICKTYDESIWLKFEKLKDGTFHNLRLHNEILKRSNFCNSRRNNALRTKNTCKAYAKHMEDENEDVNEDRIKDEIEIKSKENTSKVFVGNAEYRKVCETLKNRILEIRQQKITDVVLKKWEHAVDLMIRIDKRTLPEIEELINECHNMEPSATGFTWRNNILSMEKLRLRWNEGKIYIGMNGKKVKANKTKLFKTELGKTTIYNPQEEIAGPEEVKKLLEKTTNSMRGVK
jgi:hypothetical protein